MKKPKLEVKKKEKEKLYKEPIDDFIFDESKRTQHLNSSIGIFKGHYYFGQLIPKWITTKAKTEKRNFEIKTQQEKLVLICDDYNFHEVGDKFEIEHNVNFSDPPLINSSRWNLEDIKNYIELGRYGLKIIKPLELFNKIKEQYKKYISFDEDEFYDVNALWDIGTYLFILFDAYPYIEHLGLKGTGKTKVGAVSEKIAFNGISFINPTGATIFRYVQVNNPSLMLDEMEDLFSNKKTSKDKDDIIQLYNSGWQKGAVVPRLEKVADGKYKILQFNAYCPKRFSSIQGLRGALQDRTIQIIMTKPNKDDDRGDLWPEDNEEFKEIRNKIYPFILKNWQEIKANYNSEQLGIKKEFKLNNRDWQIWKPLLCIAKLIDNKLYKKIGKFAEEQTESKYINDELSSDTWGYLILESLIEITANKKDLVKISPNEIRGSLTITEDKRKPSLTYISRFLNKIGFKKYYKRFRDGTYYLINQDIVSVILTKSKLMSQPSQLSLTNIKTDEEEVTDR